MGLWKHGELRVAYGKSCVKVGSLGLHCVYSTFFNNSTAAFPSHHQAALIYIRLPPGWPAFNIYQCRSCSDYAIGRKSKALLLPGTEHLQISTGPFLTKVLRLISAVRKHGLQSCCVARLRVFANGRCFPFDRFSGIRKFSWQATSQGNFNRWWQSMVTGRGKTPHQLRVIL